MPMPSPTAMTKKAMILMQTSHHSALTHQSGSRAGAEASPVSGAKPVRTERMTMPMTSSMTAAATMEVPTLVLSLPSSFSAATVTDTEVAVRMAP